MSFSRQLNPDVNAFQRKFVNEVRRCEEMERKLRKWTRGDFKIFLIWLKYYSSRQLPKVGMIFIRIPIQGN